jgi:hypothetical protein
MKAAQSEDHWVWVVVQEPGGKEQFLGQYDKQQDISYIPAFNSKEAAQQCFLHMTRRSDCKYEIQAILLEELAKDAGGSGFIIYLLNGSGDILKKIKP